MTPARTNQNWLPGIFNEILGDNWLADYVARANNGGIERVLL